MAAAEPRSVRGSVHSLHRKPEQPGEEGLPKPAVEELLLSERGVEGDFNRYRHERLADASDQALLILPFEVLIALQAEGWPVNPGDLGENVTSQGIPYTEFRVGDRFQIGDAIAQVSKPCLPCSYLERLPYVGQVRGTQFQATLLGRRGWFASLVREGRVRRGDAVTRLSGPGSS
jgi:MOSC domain-containing protein YiiM